LQAVPFRGGLRVFDVPNGSMDGKAPASKKPRREIFRQGNVWCAPEYFVYFKRTERQHGRKSSGVKKAKA